MAVHLDVLSSMADKVTTNAQAGQRPRPNDITELLYPLQRARQFAHQYRHKASLESYRLFVALLDRYQAFVEKIDADRGDVARWRRTRKVLPAENQGLAEAAQAVRNALAGETRA